MSKRILSFICAVIVLCVSLVIPSFALSNNGIDFSTQPIPVLDSFTHDNLVSNGLASSSTGTRYYFGSSTQDVFVFARTSTSGLFFVSPNSSYTVYRTYNNSNDVVSYNYDGTYDSTSNLYYSSYGGYGVVNVSSLPQYSDLNTALADVRDYLDNSSTSISINSLDVPAGNVAYIKTSGVTTLDLTTSFVQYSQLFSDSWANITQKVTWTNSLPTGTVTFPLSGMSTLTWTKSGNTNVLGQTQAASASYQTVANQYFVIYNPLYQQYGQGNNYDMNGTIHVSGDMIEVKVFPLSGSVVTGQGLVSNSDSDYGDFYELQDDGNGGVEWVDQSGTVSNGPQTGGTSLLPQDATIQSLAAQILQIITKVGQSITNIFNVGHQAIVTLVGHASEFVTHFQNLYTWLPADIFAVLSSAIILAITIGIIKVFI